MLISVEVSVNCKKHVFEIHVTDIKIKTRVVWLLKLPKYCSIYLVIIFSQTIIL